MIICFYPLEDAVKWGKFQYFLRKWYILKPVTAAVQDIKKQQNNFFFLQKTKTISDLTWKLELSYILHFCLPKLYPF